MGERIPFVVGPVESPELGGVPVRAAMVHHEWFGNVLAPVGLRDLGEIILILAAVWGATGWRGQARLDWKIESSLVRRVRNRNDALGEVVDTPDALERVVGETEARLLGRARLAGHDYRGALSDLQLCALLQHHGAGTRLLDCTTSPHIAMWFASRHHSKEWGLVIAFDMSEVEPILTAQQRDRPMHQIVRDLGKSAGRWTSSALSTRMPAQQGFFLFSRAAEYSWGSLATAGATLTPAGTVPGMTLIAISPALKSEFNSICEAQYGFTDERLFPDLDGWATAHGALKPFPPDFYDGANILP